LLARSLIGWQWPDGGWNCDPAATGRSSFHESLAAAWGLHEYAQATGDLAARLAAGRAAELLLSHRLFRSVATGQVISRTWLARATRRTGITTFCKRWSSCRGSAKPPTRGLVRRWTCWNDAACRMAAWQASGCWWKPPGSPITPEVVDWGRSGPNEMITLNAMRVLRAARRHLVRLGHRRG
jgi:hypothetical protein